MAFPGHFSDHIIVDKLDILSVSFLVDSLRRERGGCAANMAYNLALLGQPVRVMATAGDDFDEYGRWLEQTGVDTSLVRQVAGEFTSSYFVSTDQKGNQIASFYIGAMGAASQLTFFDLNPSLVSLVVISPNDPDAMNKYVRECRELGIDYVYDPSQQIVRLEAEHLIDGIRGSRLLIANEYEFELIRHKTGLEVEDILDLTPTLIVTRSERGSIIRSDGQVHYIPAVHTVQQTDPTGVGDAYRAGVLAGMLSGVSWETAGRMGSLAAVYALEQHGTQNHTFTLAEFARRYEGSFGHALAYWPADESGVTQRATVMVEASGS
jgi:adenosine kinase